MDENSYSKVNLCRTVIGCLISFMSIIACTSIPQPENNYSINYESIFVGYHGLATAEKVSPGDISSVDFGKGTAQPSIISLLEEFNVQPQRTDNIIPNIKGTVEKQFQAGINAELFSKANTLGIGGASIKSITSQISDSYILDFPLSRVDIEKRIRTKTSNASLVGLQDAFRNTSNLQLITRVLYINKTSFEVKFNRNIGVSAQADFQDKFNASVGIVNNDNKDISFIYNNPIAIGYKSVDAGFIADIVQGLVDNIVDPTKKSDTEAPHELVNNMASWEPKHAFDGRVGYASFNNTAIYPVSLSLWHPDSRTLFISIQMPSGEHTITDTNGKEFTIGSDWGIQIGGSNSKILNINDVSKYITINSKPVWVIDSNKYFYLAD